MTTTLSLLLICLLCLVFPVLFLAWLTESRTERIRRLHARGISQRSIAAQLGISRRKVSQALAY